MVALKEENLPPNEWRLGWFQLVCPGTDGKIRVADVLTALGIIILLFQNYRLPHSLNSPKFMSSFVVRPHTCRDHTHSP